MSDKKFELKELLYFAGGSMGGLGVVTLNKLLEQDLTVINDFGLGMFLSSVVYLFTRNQSKALRAFAMMVPALSITTYEFYRDLENQYFPAMLWLSSGIMTSLTTEQGRRILNPLTYLGAVKNLYDRIYEYEKKGQKQYDPEESSEIEKKRVSFIERKVNHLIKKHDPKTAEDFKRIMYVDYNVSKIEKTLYEAPGAIIRNDKNETFVLYYPHWKYSEPALLGYLIGDLALHDIAEKKHMYEGSLTEFNESLLFSARLNDASESAINSHLIDNAKRYRRGVLRVYFSQSEEILKLKRRGILE